jgi:hypothetical protein
MGPRFRLHGSPVGLEIPCAFTVTNSDQCHQCGPKLGWMIALSSPVCVRADEMNGFDGVHLMNLFLMPTKTAQKVPKKTSPNKEAAPPARNGITGQPR